MHPQVEEIAAIVQQTKVSAVTTGAGNPAKYIPGWKEAGIKVLPVVPSVALAQRMQRAGADAVIVEGCEAGGHIGELTTMALLPQVVDAVKIPVVAAGRHSRCTAGFGCFLHGRLRGAGGHLPAGKRGMPDSPQL